MQEEGALTWWLHSREAGAQVSEEGIQFPFSSKFGGYGGQCGTDGMLETFRGILCTTTQLTIKLVDDANEWCLAGYRQLRLLVSLL